MKSRNRYLPKHIRCLKYGGEGWHSSGILRVILFDIFISKVGHGIWCIIKFVGATK